jgi:hypothetical protein
MFEYYMMLEEISIYKSQNWKWRRRPGEGERKKAWTDLGLFFGCGQNLSASKVSNDHFEFKHEIYVSNFLLFKSFADRLRNKKYWNVMLFLLLLFKRTKILGQKEKVKKT